MTSSTLSVTLSSAPASIVNRVFSRTSSRRRIGRQTRRTIRVPTPFRSPSACALPTRRTMPGAWCAHESDPALRSSRGCVGWPSWLVARQPRRSHDGFPAQRGRYRGRTLLRAQAARYSPELGIASAMPSNPPMQPTHLRHLHQRPRHLRFTSHLRATTRSRRRAADRQVVKPAEVERQNVGQAHALINLIIPVGPLVVAPRPRDRERPLPAPCPNPAAKTAPGPISSAIEPNWPDLFRPLRDSGRYG